MPWIKTDKERPEESGDWEAIYCKTEDQAKHIVDAVNDRIESEES